MTLRYICDRCGESSVSRREEGILTVGRFKLDIAVSEPLQSPRLPSVDGHLCLRCFDQMMELIRAALASKRT